MYLLIQNPGEAPVEGFTLLGVSTTRDCGIDGAIGQFGSGNKHAINVLLRAGLKVFAYCGKTRLDFQVRDEVIDDGLVKKTVQRVVCKFGGTSTKTVDLGWVLDFGAIDWTELGMALREFISNAIDRTVREEDGEFIPAMQDARLRVSPVEEVKIKAKAGYTRVYVEMNEDVWRYYGELPRRFLHFSDNPEQVKQRLLPKAGRNLRTDCPTAMIYREGVFVREISELTHPSVYDYNLRSSEIEIDECRNSSEYAVRTACARTLRRAAADELVPVLRSWVAMEETYESSLDSYYLCAPYSSGSEREREQWQSAWEAVAGDAVLCPAVSAIAECVARKGYQTQHIRETGLVDALERLGIRTSATILSEHEQKGRVKLPPSSTAQAAVDEVWGWLEAYNLTNGREKPAVGCFRSVMGAGTVTLGFADNSGVYLEEAHASGLSKALLQTALEECVHYATKAGDESRDLQDFLFRLVVEVLAVDPACTEAA